MTRPDLPTAPAISVQRIDKSFKDVHVLRGVDFSPTDAGDRRTATCGPVCPEPGPKEKSPT